MLTRIKDQLITALIIIGGAIALLFKARRDGVNQGRKEVKDEFQANDMRQADEIRQSVEDALGDNHRSDVDDRLRSNGGLRDGSARRSDKGVG